MQKPDLWLKKVVEIQKAALWLDERQGEGRVESSQPPLVRLPSASVAALLPVFAVIEAVPEAGVGEDLKARVSVSLASIEAAVNERQIEWLRTFAASMLALQAAGGELLNSAQ